MKTNKFISAALFVLAATACNTDYITENQTNSNLEPMTISGIETKTVLDSDGRVNWTYGDQIAIYDNKGGKNIFTNSIDAVASFSGNVTKGTTKFWGVYPEELVSSASSSNGTITATLPADQTPAAGTFAEDLNISVTTGFKTPGTPAVDGISFHNVCGLISFTVPTRIAAKKVTFSTESRAIAGTLSVDCELNTASVEGEGSNSVSMEGDFAAGSTFYFVVTTGEIAGFKIDVETEAGSLYYKSASNGTINVTAGSLTKLGDIDFKNGTATATAAHTYSSGVLTGTSLTVNHGIPSNMYADVTKLYITVAKNGTTYRTFDASSVTDATVTPSGKIYLPQGTYTVSGYYTMNGVSTNINTDPVIVEAPTFSGNATVVGTTSYSLYNSSGASAANDHAAETISNITATCNAISTISANVLNEVPVNYSITLDGSSFKTGTTKSTTVSAGNKTGASWGSHTLAASFTFDGVTLSGSSNCHITGLPYTLTHPAQNWSIVENGALNYIKFTDSYIFLTSDSSTGSVKTPDFSIPDNINISVSTTFKRIRDGIALDWTFSVHTYNSSGNTSQIDSHKGNGKNTIHTIGGDATFTSSCYNILCRRYYWAGSGPDAQITDFTIRYR